MTTDERLEFYKAMKKEAEREIKKILAPQLGTDNVMFTNEIRYGIRFPSIRIRTASDWGGRKLLYPGWKTIAAFDNNEDLADRAEQIGTELLQVAKMIREDKHDQEDQDP